MSGEREFQSHGAMTEKGYALETCTGRAARPDTGQAEAGRAHKPTTWNSRAGLSHPTGEPGRTSFVTGRNGPINLIQKHIFR